MPLRPGWENTDHPPYSLDLAPRDLHLARLRRTWLASELQQKPK